MAHQPKPFYRSARNAFYVQIGKQQIKLVVGPNNATNEKAAWIAFHKLMAERESNPPAPTHPKSPTPIPLTVGEVFEKFLDWCQRHRSARTYEWSRNHIQSFCDHLKLARTMAATDLKPFHVVEWVDSKGTWGSNQKRGAIVAVTRPFNWAAKLGYIPASPVRGVEKPTPTKRDSRMTPDDFQTLLSHVKDEPFRDLLTFAYEAGCRPQEARRIEARHVKLEQSRIEIPPAEAKGKQRWRVIYLSNKAQAIVARLADTHPNGTLFRNLDGNPWKAQAIVCRFQRLLVKLSGAEDELPRLQRFNYRDHKPEDRVAAKKAHQERMAEARKKRAKLARKSETRFAMYDLRHCFASRKLKEGHDPITVAALLGHKDGVMLCRYYESISTDGDHLRQAVS